jgi:hypothetical protein
MQKIYICGGGIMIKLISECNDFMKSCKFTYAFCGGHALELFLNKKIRSHSDIDLSIFDEDRKNIVEFIQNQGWNIYKSISEWERIFLFKNNSSACPPQKA